MKDLSRYDSIFIQNERLTNTKKLIFPKTNVFTDAIFYSDEYKSNDLLDSQ